MRDYLYVKNVFGNKNVSEKRFMVIRLLVRVHMFMPPYCSLSWLSWNNTLKQPKDCNKYFFAFSFEALSTSFLCNFFNFIHNILKNGHDDEWALCLKNKKIFGEDL